VRIGGKVYAVIAAAVLSAIPFSSRVLAQVTTVPAVTAPPTTAEVPVQPPAASLVISGKAASTWADRGGSGASIVQVAGPVTIEIERTTLSARDAVVWIEAVRPTPGGPAMRPGDEQVTVALLGDAKVQRRR
jgi:hypothetical protein